MDSIIRRAIQPSLSDYRTSSQILQSAIKRTQTQPLYNKYVKAARLNYDIETLKQMSKPFLIKDLRKAWKEAMYSLTIYKKPLNKLNKAELYHELLNVNHNFETLPKKQIRAARRRA